MDLSHLPKKHFGAVLADPAWNYDVWAEGSARNAQSKYKTMSVEEIAKIPVADVMKDDSVLFMWFTWPRLKGALEVLEAWGFRYSTCAFCWIKGDARQVEMFQDHIDPFMGMGYWTRSNAEAALLGVRGHPKRLNADVLQAIVEPRREHSRKPSCTYERIERLVPGPMLELFARNTRSGWVSIGNESTKFGEVKDGTVNDAAIQPLII